MIPLVLASKGGKTNAQGASVFFAGIQHHQPELDFVGSLANYVASNYHGRFKKVIDAIAVGDYERWLSLPLYKIGKYDAEQAPTWMWSNLVNKALDVLVEDNKEGVILHIWRHTGTYQLTMQGVPKSDVMSWGRWAEQSNDTAERHYRIKCAVSFFLLLLFSFKIVGK